MPSNVLKCGKSWQNAQHCLVWQVDILCDGERQRSYLTIDATQQSRRIELTNDKPANLTATGAMASKIRKHVPSCMVTEILQDPSDATLCLPLRSNHGSEASFFVFLDNAKPPSLQFVDQSRQSLTRIGQSGTFTKAKPYLGAWPEPSWQNILPQLLSSSSTNAPRAADTESQDAADPALSSQRDLARRLVRKLKTLRKSLDKQTQHARRAEYSQQFQRQAQLAQRYLHRVQSGMSSLELSADETGDQPATIELDEHLAPGANLERLFDKAKRAQHAQISGGKQIAALQQDIAALEQDIAKLRSPQLLAPTMLQEISRRHRLKANDEASKSARQASNPVAKPFRTFFSDSGQCIFVGKSAADSDQLLKAAKANDFWFHCVGGTGSHVIVPFHKTFANGLPDSVEKDAAILALHYSNAKQDMAGEVYLSRRQYLRKRKGMPAGLWTIERSQTRFLKYTAAELAAIFARQEA